MKTIYFFISVAIATFFIFHTDINTSASTEKPEDLAVSFQNDVFPLIEEHCLPCHLREERNMSRLFMDDYDMLMKGGFNGPPIEPGNAEESLLIKKIKPDPPFGERMPMRSERYLNKEEIDVFIRWIENGAENN